MTSNCHHQRLGGSAFNHGPSSNAEQEYDRLRDLARKEQGQHQRYAAEARQAYERGDGAGAHEASQKSKQHAAKADEYNRQASEFIFRENNAVGKVDGDTIDLHGQFVEEAEEILEQRIRYAQRTGQAHLHVVVGKGNHSPGHIQKIKPRVEQVCRELNLQYHTEPNAGRIYIDLQGGQRRPDDHHSHRPQHETHGRPLHETAYPMGSPPHHGYHPQHMDYSNAAQGGCHGVPQQQMHVQEPEQDNGIKCCAVKICVVM